MKNLDMLENAFASSLDMVKEMKMSKAEHEEEMSEMKPTNSDLEIKMDRMMDAFEEMLKKMQKMIEESKPHSIPYVS